MGTPMSTPTPNLDEPYLVRTDREGIVTLTLNRPGQFNSLSQEMLTACRRSSMPSRSDAAVRAVVVAGAGKAFCAGHDLKEMRANHSKAFMQEVFKQCGKVMMTITRMPQPVIARSTALPPPPVASWCRCATWRWLPTRALNSRCQASIVGLFCSTPSVALGRNLGRKQALEMLLTGDFIDAAEAQRQGLVNRVVPLSAGCEIEEACRVDLRQVAVAVAMGKQMFYKQLEMGLDGAYQYASEVPWPAT
jgi:enoyl-CoA hydratase/carnithine racemase